MGFFGGGLGSLVQTAGNIISMPIQDYYNRKAASKQYGYEKSLMDYQNEWNLAQWNRENDYNTPKAIMERYTDAGLNPNLIYGNSYTSPAHLESATAHAPNVRAANVDLMQGVLQAYNLEAQNELLHQQARLTKEQADNWQHDHLNTNKEFLDFLSGFFGGSTAKDAGSYIRDKFNDLYKSLKRSLFSDTSTIDITEGKPEGMPDWQYRHLLRLKKFERDGKI